jgi:CBS domain-containing protein
MPDHDLPQPDYALTQTVKSLIKMAPVFVGCNETVAQAAQQMQRARIGSVLVTTNPPGIITDRDLRARVLAANLKPETPVTRVMTRPLKTIDANAPAFTALCVMLDENIHHLPVIEDGRIVGVISATDLLLHQTRNPLYLRQTLETLEDVAALGCYAENIGGLVDFLFNGGLGVVQISRIISGLNDLLIKRLVHLAQLEIGPAPATFAWIVFGSEGRMEQTLLTDQDNALVYQDSGSEAQPYFAELAQRVVDGLIRAGVPPCAGGFMATRWCKPLSEWQRLFTNWVRLPEARALLDASIFFDFRAIAGALSLEPLDEIAAAAAEEKLFLARMLNGALEFRPPLGVFNRLRAERGKIDLKKTGIMPIVGMARVAALAAASRQRSTLERLSIAGASRAVLSQDSAQALAEIFPFLLRLRLDAQLEARKHNRPLDHRVGLADLSALERRHLKESFMFIKRIQDELRAVWRLDRLA